MWADPTFRTHSPGIGALLIATMLLTLLSAAQERGERAYPQPQAGPQAELFVIQGRITVIQATLVSVKTPDGYPARAGGHAQFVTFGPAFKVDISHARILLPDGMRADKKPLAVGDRVLMVLSGHEPAQPMPGSQPGANPIYVASIIERIVQSDTIATH